MHAYGSDVYNGITTFFIIVFGKYFFQWVRIDESGVYGKCLWGTIAFCKWEDLKEIYIARFPVSHPNAFTTKWFVFDDGKEEVRRGNGTTNGLMMKGHHIRLTYSKRALKAIQQYWQKDFGEREIAV